jgi:hypothetical protein
MTFKFTLSSKPKYICAVNLLKVLLLLRSGSLAFIRAGTAQYVQTRVSGNSEGGDPWEGLGRLEGGGSLPPGGGVYV